LYIQHLRLVGTMEKCASAGQPGLTSSLGT
jgi:hypothetical protein